MIDAVSPLSTDDVAAIHDARATGLEIRFALNGRSIAFDRRGAVIGPVDVVVEWAAREPSAGAGGATNVIGVDGDLHGRPADVVDVVAAGDLFMINGNLAEVTRGPLEINGVGVVPFRMTSGSN